MVIVTVLYIDCGFDRSFQLRGHNDSVITVHDGRVICPLRRRLPGESSAIDVGLEMLLFALSDGIP